MLYVTHDQDEALSLSDRIVVMHAGRIEQNDAPEAVWNRPATPFVARFMGCENLFEVGPALPVPAPAGATHLAWRATSVPVTGPGGPGIEGRVLARSYLGERVEYLVETALGKVKATGVAQPISQAVIWDEGAVVRVALDPARAAVIPPPARSHGSERASPAAPVPGSLA